MKRMRQILAIAAASVLAWAAICDVCESDTGRLIKRNRNVVRKFQKQHPCPFAPGDCIADHVVPLRCGSDAGGPLKKTVKQLDVASNLQWQRKADARQKDSWEGIHCAELAKDPHFRPHVPGTSTTFHLLNRSRFEIEQKDTPGRERYRSIRPELKQ